MVVERKVRLSVVTVGPFVADKRLRLVTKAVHTKSRLYLQKNSGYLFNRLYITGPELVLALALNQHEQVGAHPPHS